MYSRMLGLLTLGTAIGAVAAAGVVTVPAQAQELKTINFITSNNHSCGNYPQFVGPVLGLAEAQGLTFNSMNSETTVPFIAFLDTKDADFVMLDSAQVLQVGDKDQPHRVVYEVYTFATEGIVVPADSPIQDLTGLKGTTIGLASDRDQITTIMTLDVIGETLESYEIETVVVGDSGPVMANALSSGQIDAFAGGSSDRGNIVAAGVQIRNITPLKVSENPANNWTMATARFDEGFAVPFLKAWSQSQLSGIIDTKAIASICKESVPEQWENPAVGEKIVVDQVYTYQVQRSVRRGEPRPWVWEGIQGPYIKIGEISATVPTDKILDDRFIDDANDYTTAEVAAAIQAWKDENPTKLIP